MEPCAHVWLFCIIYSMEISLSHSLSFFLPGRKMYHYIINYVFTELSRTH